MFLFWYLLYFDNEEINLEIPPLRYLTTTIIDLFLQVLNGRNHNSHKSYPAKNMRRNHDPGTANNKIASSILLSSEILHGMHASIKRLDTKKIVFGGELD